MPVFVQCLKPLAELPHWQRNEPCREYPGLYLVYYQGEEFARCLYVGEAHKEAQRALQLYEESPEDQEAGLSLQICWRASQDDPRIGQVWFTSYYQLGHYNQFGVWKDS